MFLFNHRFATCFATLLTACLLSAVISTPTVSAAAKGPEASIAMLQKAMDTRNLALAEKYLDIDGVSAKIVDVLLAEGASVKSLHEEIPALGLALAIGGVTNTTDLLKDILCGEAREYLRHGVVSGSFSGNSQEGASIYGGLFRKAFRGEGKDKITFSPGKRIKRKGKAILVATTLTRGAENDSYSLELRLERKSGVWRVVELANARDLTRKAAQKEAK